MLVKTLLETNQAIPDFLQEHIPEGFVPGEGNVEELKFEMDSDEEEEGGNDGGDNGDAGGGAWGATSDEPKADAWGQTAGGAEASGGGWGATASGGGWGTGAETTQTSAW